MDLNFIKTALILCDLIFGQIKEGNQIFGLSFIKIFKRILTIIYLKCLLTTKKSQVIDFLIILLLKPCFSWIVKLFLIASANH